MNRILPLACLAATALTITAAPGGASAANVAAGREVALMVCSACHVVAPDQEFAPILNSPAPAFRLIAQRPGVSVRWLRTFIANTHPIVSAHPTAGPPPKSPSPYEMPNPSLLDDQIDDVAAYIVSLKASK